MDAVGELLINTLMASGASRGEILEIDRGLLDIIIQDEVSIMTVRTYGTGKQSFLDQATAMNTAGIVHQDVSSR